MKLIRGIESHGPRQAIVRAVGQVCNDLGIDVIAEGVETTGEYRWLANAGVRLFQGYLFAKPAFESFPTVNYPEPLDRSCPTEANVHQATLLTSTRFCFGVPPRGESFHGAVRQQAQHRHLAQVSLYLHFFVDVRIVEAGLSGVVTGVAKVDGVQPDQ